jgi:hypothetical protein
LSSAEAISGKKRTNDAQIQITIFMFVLRLGNCTKMRVTQQAHNLRLQNFGAISENS